MPDKKIVFGKQSTKRVDTNWVSESDFYKPTVDRETITRTLQDLKRIQQSHINGIKIPSLFAYEDTSIWWFFYMPLFYKINSAIDFIVNFSNFIEKVNPAVIEIKDFSKLELILKICKKKRILIKYSSNNFLIFKFKLKIKNLLRKKVSKNRTKLKIQKRLNLFNKKFSARPSLDNKILISASSVYRRDVFVSKSKKSERGEWIIQNIIDLLDEGKAIVGLDYSSKTGENEKILEERLNSQISWIPIESLFIQKNNSKKYSKFLEKYKKILSMPQFQQLFKYDEISYWTEAESIFNELLHWYHLPFWLEFFDSCLRLFSIEKPKTIFITYERGPIGLALITAAKRYGIKTIAISHEIIYENHEGFSHEDFATLNNPHGYLLPDITLLFGKYSKEVLIKQGYPEEKFVVFGNSNYFNLEKILQSLNYDLIIKKYEIPQNSKIILFTTEMLQEYYTGLGNFNYDVQIWNKLLQKFSNDKEFFFILKPHPIEKNIEIYKNILGKFKPNNFKIIQGNTTELIFISDLIISIFSNSIMDSIAFGKPVITVSFDKVTHPIPYEKFGVIIPSTLEQLPKIIKRSITNNELKKSYSINRDNFIKYQYNIPVDNPKSILDKILNR